MPRPFLDVFIRAQAHREARGSLGNRGLLLSLCESDRLLGEILEEGEIIVSRKFAVGARNPIRRCRGRCC